MTGYRLPNLVWLRAFEAAARLGSFTAAAEELCLTQAAVSHQVRSLEETIGFRLFERKARSLALTTMGHAYLPSVRKAMEELSLVTQGLFGPLGRRSVTLRAPISTAVLWLAPRLKRFRAAHPDIQIRLVSAVWADSVSDEEVDVDIRLGTGSWPGLQSEKLSGETTVPVCAVGQETRLRSLADIREEEIVHIIGFRDDWGRLLRDHGLTYDPEKVALAVDTTLAAVEMVAGGGGVALILKRLAEGLVNAGRVAIPFAAEVEIDTGHYLVHDPESFTPNRDAAVLKDWLRQEFAAGTFPAPPR
ncbi:MAG: LysR substrate-binding domain-containing protein [Paracoccaceae bacterium]